MKKRFVILICGFVLTGCAQLALNTAYDVTRLTWQDRYSIYYTGPVMNKCKLTFGVDTGEFKMWLHDPPPAGYITDDAGGKYKLYSQSGREASEKYFLLTKKYLEDHKKSGLHFSHGKKEYFLPGFYVEGFLTRVPGWVQ